jgi:hypothetical protein
MKWPFFRRRRISNPQLVDTYRQMRRIGMALNITLIKQLPKAAVPECGKKLGLSKAGTLIFNNNDDEIAVLYDYCLYHYRRGNKNVIERYLEESPPEPESAEMTLLRAMSDAHYSVFRLVEIVPQQGAVLFDLVREENVELIDLSLAETGMPGTILVARVLALPGFRMSSGTMIPLPEALIEERILPLIDKFMPEDGRGSRTQMATAQEAAFTGQLIRLALHEGGADNAFYTDIDHAE